MAEFTPWSKMTPQDPAPSESGTKRDYGNMLNERTKIKKKREHSTHGSLPQKLKLTF